MRAEGGEGVTVGDCKSPGSSPADCKSAGTKYIPANEVSGGTKEEKNKRLGVVAQDLERVLPEAVTADENGLLYVDYDALTVFLIEAVKEQRREMELMRKTLEEHGLLEPEKH